MTLDNSCGELKAQISNLLETGVKEQASIYVEEYKKVENISLQNVLKAKLNTASKKFFDELENALNQLSGKVAITQAQIQIKYLI